MTLFQRLFYTLLCVAGTARKQHALHNDAKYGTCTSYIIDLILSIFAIFTELPAAPSLKRGSNAGMVVGIVLVLALAALVVVVVTIGIVV